MTCCAATATLTARYSDETMRTALDRLLNETIKPEIVRTEKMFEQYRLQKTMAAAIVWIHLKPDGIK